jgi:pimeloyl-ACP methyl ester carboxylesterase
MADFLLIHGSAHGAWCWRDVLPALAAHGHSARAIDLPGNGANPTPPEKVTLNSSRDAVLAASTPDTFIVGHSWGGYPISAAAETDPGAMRALIYLCAYVPVSGLSMVDMRKRARRQPVMPAVIRNPDGVTMSFDPEMVPSLFYPDCPPETVDFAMRHLCPQAIRPQSTPLTVTHRLAAVHKAYIRCTRDGVIPPEYQAEMTRNWPPETLFEMPTSHSPFFADPTGLAALLDRIARTLMPR